MLAYHAVYKYEMPYKGLFLITWCFTKVMVNLQYGLIQIRHNIRRIKPYKSDTNIEDINPKNMCDDINIWSPVLYFCIVIKIGNKVCNQATQEYLDVNSYRSGTRNFSWWHHFLHMDWAFTRIGDAFRKRILLILMCLNFKWL